MQNSFVNDTCFKANLIKAVLSATLLMLTALPLVAVTKGGEPDAGEHPYVGQLVFFVPDAPSSVYPDPGSWFTCSGTLLNGVVLVTAGHCTFGVGLDGASTTNNGQFTNALLGHGSGGNDVWFTTNENGDQWNGFPATANYATQAERYIARRDFLNANSLWVRGNAYPHPLYDDLAFYFHDAGVVSLGQSIFLDTYGRIPGLDYLERYAGRRNDHFFEVVGYGLEKVLPAPKFDDFGGDTRLKAEPRLLNLVSNPKKTYIQLSNNPRTGGTCFGDSGGPTFDTTTSNLVVAVTSFGHSPNCTGVGGAYRLDQPDDLAFLALFGITP